MPSFFRPQAQSDLGLLVILEHVLAGERFDKYASVLAFQDRPVAKALLENQRSQLRQRVLHHLEVAYGIDRSSTDSVDTSHELNDHFESLFLGFDPQPPVGANLAQAMQHLLEQALAHQFPAHPHFVAAPKGARLKKVYEEIRRATQAENYRIDDVPKPIRPDIQAIASPLKLGDVHDNVFILSTHWKDHFDPKVAEVGGVPTVGQLRKWMDEPKPTGLPKIVQNCVILIYAEQTNRTFYLHGAPAEATLNTMPDQLELRTWVGPDEQDWRQAQEVAGHVFGLTSSPLLNSTNVEELAKRVVEMAAGNLKGCQDLCRVLRDRCACFGIDPAGAARVKTADAVLALVGRLERAQPNDVVKILAGAQIETSGTAMGKSRTSAEELVHCIKATDWSVFDAISGLPAEYEAAAAEIRQTLCRALETDEHAVSLADTLSQCQRQAVLLLTKAAKRTASPKEPASPEGPPTPIGRKGPAVPEPPKPLPPTKRVVTEGRRDALSSKDADELFETLQKQMNEDAARRLTIQWRIDEDVTQQ